MRVLVVGASGAIGTRLVPQLRERGHKVIGSCHSPGNAGRLRTLGAQPIVLDALDATAAREAVAAARPDAIIYQATAPADVGALLAGQLEVVGRVRPGLAVTSGGAGLA